MTKEQMLADFNKQASRVAEARRELQTALNALEMARDLLNEFYHPGS